MKHRFIYPVREIVKTLDGDTIRTIRDCGEGLYLQRDCRLIAEPSDGEFVGVDTPEKNTIAGQLVKRWVQEFLGDADLIRTESVKKGKFAGRYVGTIQVYQGLTDEADTEWHDLGDWLLDAGFAKVFKRKRDPWTDEQLADVVDRIKQMTDGRGADYAFEAIGSGAVASGARLDASQTHRDVNWGQTQGCQQH